MSEHWTLRHVKLIALAGTPASLLIGAKTAQVIFLDSRCFCFSRG